MPKLLLSMVKLLVAWAMFHLSCVMRFPIIVFFALGWCAWIWFVVPAWKGRRLAALGFGLTVLGWWCITSLWQHFAQITESRSIGGAGAYWGEMAMASSKIGMAMLAAGIILLTCTDYLRPPKPKITAGLTNGGEADEGQVWPPAPKQRR